MQGLAALSAVAGPQCVLFRKARASLRSRARSIALFVRGGGVPPLNIWDLFCCRCFQMLKLQPKFFLN